jgi:signal transduction histidine kinase
LIAPRLLWSSQYGIRLMLAFVAGVAALDIFFAALYTVNGGPAIKFVRDQVMVRAVVFVVVGFVVARLSAAQREQRRGQAEKNAQLTHYANTLEQLAVSRERNRMARELHDTLAHTLSAMTVQLGALEVQLDTHPQAGRDTLAAVRTMSRAGLHELRWALHALRARPLEDLGFAFAVSQLAEAAAERAGLQLEMSLPQQMVSFRPEVEQHLYRIAEEAVANVVRHANAKKLTVAVRRKRGRLGLVVSDGGVGFDLNGKNGHASERHSGYGLIGMRERALLCSADLTISSRLQHGTTIQVWISEESA